MVYIRPMSRLTIMLKYSIKDKGFIDLVAGGLLSPEELIHFLVYI